MYYRAHWGGANERQTMRTTVDASANHAAELRASLVLVFLHKKPKSSVAARIQGHFENWTLVCQRSVGCCRGLFKVVGRWM